jgi:thiosulfate/3-mercaptopyruvate sulfurtransferase
MKKKYHIQIAALLFLLIAMAFIKKQTEPWNPDQLMAPADLATIINSSTATKPLIISVGPAGLIKGAVDIGSAREKENLNKLKKLLSEEKKDREIVIYCGCCPFQNCPNIRPAFSLLNSMKFTKHKLLNLSHNLKADWINYGYPMATDNRAAQ